MPKVVRLGPPTGAVSPPMRFPAPAATPLAASPRVRGHRAASDRLAGKRETRVFHIQETTIGSVRSLPTEQSLLNELTSLGRKRPA
jgi:hypothetical protein